MIKTYPTSQPDIPEGYYIEVAPDRLCAIEDVLKNKNDYSIFLGQRLALVHNGVRILVSAIDAGYCKTWDEAIKMSCLPGFQQLPTRAQALEIHRAVHHGFNRAVNELLFTHIFVGDYWTRDESDDPSIA